MNMITENKLFFLAIFAKIIYIFLITPTTALIHPKITRIEVNSDIRFRLATTSIKMAINNTEKESRIFFFEVFLPKDAVVVNINLIINGSLFEGHTKAKSKEYREWLKASKKQVPRSMRKRTSFDNNMFVANATLAGRSEAFFNITYKKLLIRHESLYTHCIPIFFRQNLVIKKLLINVSLWEPQNIRRFTAALIKDKNMPHIPNHATQQTHPRTLWKSRRNIFVSYTKKLGKLRNVYSHVFRVQYDLNRPHGNHGDILWHNNQGLLFFTHEVNKALPRDLVFTVDMSSSMRKNWRLVVQKALHSILTKMLPTERFNVLMYNRSVYEWKKELQDINNENITSAMEFVKSFQAIGISNIELALNKSLLHLNHTDPGRFKAVYFLTDGYHTTESLKTSTIVRRVEHMNQGRYIPIFTLGLGPTSDVRLLRPVAAVTGGKFKKIYERQLSNAVELMVSFFNEINSPSMMDLKLEFCENDAHRFDMSHHLYKGSEKLFYLTRKCFPSNDINRNVMVSGRDYSGLTNVSIPIINSDYGLHVNGQVEEFVKNYLDFLMLRKAIEVDDRKTIRKYQGLVFTYWTYIIILRSLQMNQNNGKSDEANAIWTQEISGAGIGDPHFMIELKGLKRPVCFDLMGTPGDIINLIYDKRNGILVNAKIICAEEEDDNCEKTYLGLISVLTPTEQWVISPKGIQVNRSHSWANENDGSKGQFTTKYTKQRLITMTWKSGKTKNKIQFLIRRSNVKKSKKTKYLDFYLIDGSGLSSDTNGIIGQFTNSRGEIMKLRRNSKGKMKSVIKIQQENKYRTFSAVLTGNRRSLHFRKECWTVWDEGKGLVRGKYEDYVTTGLFRPPQSEQELKEPKT